MQNITGHRDYDHVPPAGPPRVSLDQRCLTKLTIGASVNLNGAGTYESEPIVEDRDPQAGAMLLYDPDAPVRNLQETPLHPGWTPNWVHTHQEPLKSWWLDVPGIMGRPSWPLDEYPRLFVPRLGEAPRIRNWNEHLKTIDVFTWKERQKRYLERCANIDKEPWFEFAPEPTPLLKEPQRCRAASGSST